MYPGSQLKMNNYRCLSFLSYSFLSTFSYLSSSSSKTKKKKKKKTKFLIIFLYHLLLLAWTLLSPERCQDTAIFTYLTILIPLLRVQISKPKVLIPWQILYFVILVKTRKARYKHLTHQKSFNGISFTVFAESRV